MKFKHKVQITFFVISMIVLVFFPNTSLGRLLQDFKESLSDDSLPVFSSKEGTFEEMELLYPEEFQKIKEDYLEIENFANRVSSYQYDVEILKGIYHFEDDTLINAYFTVSIIADELRMTYSYSYKEGGKYKSVSAELPVEDPSYLDAFVRTVGTYPKVIKTHIQEYIQENDLPLLAEDKTYTIYDDYLKIYFYDGKRISCEYVYH